MFTLGPVPDLLDESLVAQATAVSSSTIGHMRDHGFAHGLRAMTAADRAAGTALTVRLPDLDSAMLHYAVDHVLPGHILVIDMGGREDRACVGAMVAFAARHRGAAAIVVDGMATDLADLEEFGIPVFARGIAPRTTRILGIEGAMNVPVQIAGATVQPGDLVIADRDGVVFLPATEFTAIAERAVAAQDLEVGAKEAILAGKPISELSGAAAKVLAAAQPVS